MYYNYPLSHSAQINVYPVELVNTDSIIVEEQNLGPASKEMLKNSIDNWSKALDGNISLALKLAGLEQVSHQTVFENKDLITDFAGLKTVKDIETFSMRYGLLGIKHPDYEQVNSQTTLVKATLQPEFIFTSYGISVFEPINLWWWHINQVQKILRLYHAVRKAGSDELLYNILEIKTHKGMFGSLAEDREVTERYFIHWTDGEPIVMLPVVLEEKPLLEIAQYTLAKILEFRISDGINLATGDLITTASKKGFMITEKRYTKYLLAAIYYELWQTINDSRNVYLCENKNCRLPFVKSGRKKYCNEACKQEAYRIRLEEKEGND